MTWSPRSACVSVAPAPIEQSAADANVSADHRTWADHAPAADLGTRADDRSRIDRGAVLQPRRRMHEGAGRDRPGGEQRRGAQGVRKQEPGGRDERAVGLARNQDARGRPAPVRQNDGWSGRRRPASSAKWSAYLGLSKKCKVAGTGEIERRDARDPPVQIRVVPRARRRRARRSRAPSTLAGGRGRTVRSCHLRGKRQHPRKEVRISSRR